MPSQTAGWYRNSDFRKFPLEIPHIPGTQKIWRRLPPKKQPPPGQPGDRETFTVELWKLAEDIAQKLPQWRWSASKPELRKAAPDRENWEETHGNEWKMMWDDVG